MSNRINKSALARMVGLSNGRITQLVKAGLKFGDDGLIDATEGAAWIKRNLDPERRTRAKPTVVVSSSPSSLPQDDHDTCEDDPLDFMEVKRRHEILKSERTAHRLSLDKQEAALWSEINQALTSWAVAERDSWLAWCQRIVPTLSAELKIDGGVILPVLRREVILHLHELAASGLVYVGPR